MKPLTDDQIKSIAEELKCGLEWVGFFKDAIRESRKLKPEIPEFGDDSIPIKHELEFEYRIG